ARSPAGTDSDYRKPPNAVRRSIESAVKRDRLFDDYEFYP
ncbi:unnamed protein product, partial [marine sediment metagenome]